MCFLRFGFPARGSDGEKYKVHHATGGPGRPRLKDERDPARDYRESRLFQSLALSARGHALAWIGRPARQYPVVGVAVSAVYKQDAVVAKDDCRAAHIYFARVLHGLPL
jgi:hypothetical protein